MINLDTAIRDVKEVLQEMEHSFYNDTNLTGHMIYKDKIYKETFVIDEEVAHYVDQFTVVEASLREMERQHEAFESFLQKLKPKERNFLNKAYRSYELPGSDKLSKLEEKTFTTTQDIGNNLFPRRPPNNERGSLNAI